MEKFDIKTAKFLLIIIGICLVFILVVWHAFDYLPANTETIETITPNVEVEDVNIAQTDNQLEEDTIVQKEEIFQEDIDDLFAEQKTVKTEPKPLEKIYDSDEVPSVRENFETVYDKAFSLKKDKEYKNALLEFDKALQLANNDNDKASCYEEISRIYALTKRYGAALSYAQKAFNLYPTSTREVLLARLYYKTGETDKATIRLNNVLRRDFEDDRE